MEPRRFFPVLVATALVILLHQVIDLIYALPFIDLATPAGRTRQLLATVARTPALLTADAILLWALVSGRQDQAIRRAGTVHYVLAGVFLLLLPLFVVDAGRVVTTLSGPDVSGFRVVTVRTMIVLPILALFAYRAGRVLRTWQSAPAEA